jgi:hypothetical protein
MREADVTALLAFWEMICKCVEYYTTESIGTNIAGVYYFARGKIKANTGSRAASTPQVAQRGLKACCRKLGRRRVLR